MGDQRESDLNLLDPQLESNIDTQSVAQISISKYPRKMLKISVLFKD